MVEVTVFVPITVVPQVQVAHGLPLITAVSIVPTSPMIPGPLAVIVGDRWLGLMPIYTRFYADNFFLKLALKGPDR